MARAAIIDAARQLFLEHGYGATTVEAISERSGVPLATVYRLFSSKHGILKALLDVSIAGDDDATPMVDRPEVKAQVRNPDPRSQLAGFVKITSHVNSRLGPLYRILVSAAGSDPNAAELLADLTRQRQVGQGVIARSLARAGALRPGLRERDAADVIHALMSPEVYRLLVIDRSWTPERYEEWLTSALIEQLLPPKGARPKTR